MLSNSQFDVPFKTQQFALMAAQEGSFHKAARKLGVSPSVIARSVDRLESELGVKIFDRSRTTFLVTDAGRIFLQEIQDAVNRVTRACDLARYYGQVSQGPLRVGFSPYIHSRLLPALGKIRSAMPEEGKDPTEPPSFVLEADCSARLIDSVLHGKLDAAFGVLPIEDEGLWIKPLVREGFCIALSKNHRRARQASTSINELDGETVFFLPRASHPGLYDETVRYIESTGSTPVLREVISFTHAMEIVAYGFGVALLPRSAAYHAHLGVLFKPVTDKLIWIETALFARRRQRPENLQNLLDTLLVQLRMERMNP